MATTRYTKLFGLSCIMLWVMLGFVCSDINEDRKECGDQLKSLSPCLPFVGGDVKAPAPACCLNLREKVNTTKKCLCLLVKDRNDPNLGLKINATLALSLPSICHAAANVSQCPEILHLDPNSPDAQVFEQFARSNSSTAVESNPTDSGMAFGKNKWLEMMVMVVGITLALIIRI